MVSWSPQCGSFRWLWKLADCTLLLFVFFPAMVFYWRGIWDLAGVYIYPNQQPLCHIIVTGIGACTFFGYIALPLVARVLSSDNKFVYVVVTRTVMFVYGALSMTYWRGVWLLADFYLLPLGWIAGLIGLVMCYGLLVVLQASKTPSVFPPFVVSLDTRPDLLQTSTRLQTKPDFSSMSGFLWHLLDACLTQFVIVTLTVLSWRHAFHIVDTFLYPDHPHWSNITSYVIGSLITIIFFILEEHLAKVGNSLEIIKQTGWVQVAYDDTIVFVVFVGSIFIWRGFWNLTTTYFITDPLIGGWTNLVTGTVMLMSLQLFSYAGACGCAMDGREPELANNVIFNTDYLRHFFRGRYEMHQTYRVAETVTSNEKVVKDSNDPAVLISYIKVGESTANKLTSIINNNAPKVVRSNLQQHLDLN